MAKYSKKAQVKIEEVMPAGQILTESGFTFDLAFTSVQKRSIRTLWIVLDEMDLMWIPVQRDWRLNERHYGALQRLNKSETAKKYGEEQVHKWRRSYDVRPLVKYLDGVPDAEIPNLNITTGIPLIYQLDENLHPIRHYYLGDAAQIKQAMQAVANQASV